MAITFFQRIVSNNTINKKTHVATTRSAAVTAAIASSTATLATQVAVHDAWSRLENFTDNTFFTSVNNPQFMWDSTTSANQTRGFAAISSPISATSNASTKDVAVSLVAFADNAFQAEIQVVNSSGTLLSPSGTGQLLTDGPMIASEGLTEQQPYNWQNIRFYSTKFSLTASGSFRVAVSLNALNYDNLSGHANPAAVAFAADIFHES